MLGQIQEVKGQIPLRVALGTKKSLFEGI